VFTSTKFEGYGVLNLTVIIFNSIPLLVEGRGKKIKRMQMLFLSKF